MSTQLCWTQDWSGRFRLELCFPHWEGRFINVFKLNPLVKPLMCKLVWVWLKRVPRWAANSDPVWYVDWYWPGLHNVHIMLMHRMQKGQTCHHKDKTMQKIFWSPITSWTLGKYIFMFGPRPVRPPSIYLSHFYRVKKHKRQPKETVIRSVRAVLINLVPFICLLHVSHSIYYLYFDKEMKSNLLSIRS